MMIVKRSAKWIRCEAVVPRVLLTFFARRARDDGSGDTAGHKRERKVRSRSAEQHERRRQRAPNYLSLAGREDHFPGIGLT